jgi:hypothetical protein
MRSTPCCVGCGCPRPQGRAGSARDRDVAALEPAEVLRVLPAEEAAGRGTAVSSTGIAFPCPPVLDPTRSAGIYTRLPVLRDPPTSAGPSAVVLSSFDLPANLAGTQQISLGETLRFRRDRVATTPSGPATGIGHRRRRPARPPEERLTALHFRSPPRHTYGLLQTRPHGSPAAPQGALGPPGELRAAPLPLRCWIPPVGAPGQDSHLRSQRPCQAHLHLALRARLRDDRRATRCGENRWPPAGRKHVRRWGGSMTAAGEKPMAVDTRDDRAPKRRRRQLRSA